MNKKSLGITIDNKERAREALAFLSDNIGEYEKFKPIDFAQYLEMIAQDPVKMIRNIFQVFHDMMTSHVKRLEDADEQDELDRIDYDCTRLFVEGSENPYFTDRLFANRLMKHMEGLRHGAQQNQIYIFHGPHGCGKSTFLNNMLKKFESYANSDAGMRYEIVWRLDMAKLGEGRKVESVSAIERLVNFIEHPHGDVSKKVTEACISPAFHSDFIEIPCISHDNPILLIPKKHRRKVLDKLVPNDKVKWKIFTEKEYEWVFSHEPCTICESIYQALLERLGSPEKVFDMVYARPYSFNRRLGNGISVFNPGDVPLKQNVMGNQMLQHRINNLFRDSNLINYTYSRFSKTNNGIYALMDIKSHNVERMVELHNIISEAVHKVEDIEENVNSLFLALMNPEDKKNIRDFPSFTDRIRYINIPYVLDIETEMKIYNNIFGRHVRDAFLPMVMDNFARIIVSSRLKPKSDALLEWIKDPSKYRLYCDELLMLLKMEIYSGHIPDWLDDADRKALDGKMWKRIFNESENEGNYGFSGRDSIRIFDRFYSMYARENRLINMPVLCSFFKGVMKDYPKMVPGGFLESLLRMYDYNVLQQVKESLYYYNEEQIAKDIKNYISALTFELGAQGKCLFTGEEIHVTESFLSSIESRLFTEGITMERRMEMRSDVLNQYTTYALPREMMVEEKDITETKLFLSLYERYVYNLKKRVLEPFLSNENFRRAIRDFDTADFKTYDKRIRSDVKFLIKNMADKFEYTEQGAKEVCIYVIDSNLAGKFK
ncbi:putative serine protein kinase, PrkA [Desulfocicer vacuolatum DSM 3385]|uniref:Putative serine protein kinase, PrkA n=1 Tax=Desulfocicer vacuolatum DSM 3385 TaxID=1121400 RepID=A0A1W2B815_9BACT|nr:serine protein kinase PrkA [Desulfocicer vacuolatum]SMC69066.1 putative serine protein kinase, PrkA [Desulfocicer vacuolatum DSM 3385]